MMRLVRLTLYVLCLIGVNKNGGILIESIKTCMSFGGMYDLNLNARRKKGGRERGKEKKRYSLE